MVDVILSWPEITVGSQAGVLRHVDNLRKQRHDAHGFKGDGWGANIEGALAEMAVAVKLNRYWLPVTEGSLDALPGDVGKVQVRSTKNPNGRLILHRDDPDDAHFIFVRGPFLERNGLRFTLVGWIKGTDAKREEWWADPSGSNRPAFFVPNEALGSFPA